MMDPNIDWKAIGGSFLTIIKQKVAGYLADHKEAEQFLIDCSEELGKLTLKHFLPGLTDQQRQDIADEIAAYQQAMMLEADAVLLDAEASAKSTLLTVLGTIFDVAKIVLPELAKVML